MSYKILSLLLDYPTEETQRSLVEIIPFLENEKILKKGDINKVRIFINEVSGLELQKWQELYTEIFDYLPSTSLYLFDHVYGDSKKRGMAMVDLKQVYATEGLEMDSNELPDYLPVLLEFIALSQTKRQGADLLAEAKKVLEDIKDNLLKVHSFYYHLMTVIVNIAAKGKAKPLNETERIELEKIQACEACHYRASE